MTRVGVRFGHDQKWPLLVARRKVELTGLNTAGCKHLMRSFLVCASRIMLLACLCLYFGSGGTLR